jgi:hypothetical protein
MCTPDRVCHCNHQPLVTRKVHEHVWPPPQAPHEEARGRRSESQEVTTSTYIARGAIHLNAARKRVSERARECHWRCELVVCARSDLACTDGAEVATRSYGSEQAASTGRHLCSTDCFFELCCKLSHKHCTPKREIWFAWSSGPSISHYWAWQSSASLRWLPNHLSPLLDVPLQVVWYFFGHAFAHGAHNKFANKPQYFSRRVLSSGCRCRVDPQ